MVDRPVVQYVLEELARAGIGRVLLVTGRRKRAIEDHFDADPELDRELGPTDTPGAGLEILYKRQPYPRGLGDAVRCAESFAAGRPVVVALGDAIIEPPPARVPGILTRLAAVQRDTGADAVLAVTEVEPDHVHRYGIVVPGAAAEVTEVADVVEKPQPGMVSSRLAVAARYVLGPRVFAVLCDTEADAGGEVQLTDALRRVIQDGGRVVAVRLAPGERRHDIGTLEGYCATFLDLALRHPALGAALRGRAAALLDDAG